MISGVLFLNPQKELTLEKLFKKYLLRIILATFIFGTFYAFLEIFFDANYQFTLKQIGIAVFNAFQGKSWDHMWYLYMIAGLYLIIPIIKIFTAYADKRTVEYILVILFIFTSLIPFSETLFSIKIGIYLPINSVYLLYLVLGYYIQYYKINVNTKLLLTIIIVYIVYMGIRPMGNGLDIPLGYNSPVIVIITFTFFCFIRQLQKHSKIFYILSPLTFGIYLLHPLFINFLYKFIKLIPENYPSILVIVLTTIITIVLSIGFTYLGRSIKIIKKYVL
jgi:surface polysaccharide O-acyltransferase-like enzyme